MSQSHSLYDYEAESAVIGALILRTEGFDEISSFLKADHFGSYANKVYFQVIKELIDDPEIPKSDGALDVVSIKKSLVKRGDWEESGEAAYLAKLLASVSVAYNVEYYARIVFQHWQQRELIFSLELMLEKAQASSQSADVEQLLTNAEKKIQQIQDMQTTHETKTFAEVLDETFQKLFAKMDAEGDVGQDTGISGLNEKTSGFRKTELLVLAARPAMGKTAMLCNLAISVAKSPAPILIFSLEQAKEELSERLLSIWSKVNGQKLRKGTIDERDQHDLMAAADEMRNLDIYINDTAGISMPQIASITRRLHRKKPLGLVVIDYLQLIVSDEKNLIREQQIASMTRRLKFLAKELDVPVLILAQLNRGVEQREDKRPKLSDLRESGAIEQDADIVMFLHRPEVYDPEDRPGEAELIVAKNRHGPTGTVRLTWLKETQRFCDYAPTPHSPGFDFQ